MKRIVIALVAFLVVGIGGYFYLNRPDSSPGNAPQLSGAPESNSQISRGEYLTKAADCIACHTTKDGGKPFAGGLAFALPFGKLYAPNITPDPATGIGKWSDEQFVKAMQDGIRSDGQHLYPAFPYASYTQLSRADVLAIKAYIFSLPAVVQANRDPDLMFPFNQRWAMGFWKAAFFENKRFVADESKSAEWNKGYYLANALAHCAECHTPRNVAFALDRRNDYAGAVIQGWRAPNLTSDPLHGIGDWSKDDLEQYLLTGHAAGRGSASGPMAEAVENSLQYLRLEDVSALVAYFRQIPAKTGNDPVSIDRAPSGAVGSTAEAPANSASAKNQLGMELFSAACASCHQWNGIGQQTKYASLTGLRSVNDQHGANVTQMILEGVNAHIRGEAIFMPSFAHAYSDTEISALANFVIEQYGNKQGLVTPQDVAAQRKNMD